MDAKSVGVLRIVAPLALGLLVMTLAPEAKAAATCFCKISWHDLTNKNSATGVLLDLTGAVNHQYTGINQQSDNNQTNCNTRCTAAAAPHTGSQSIAAAACAAGAPNGTSIRAWGAVGTREYKSAQHIGTLVNTPAVSKATCPSGSVSNTTNQPGVTTDGKCKKPVCEPITGTPLPANGTPIGTWGFTWGNVIYQWITPIISVVTPAQCKF